MADRKKLRVLWLSNAILEPADRGVSGTWLHAMARLLMESRRIEVGNVTTGRVDDLTRSDHAGASQWIAPPVRKVGKDGLPNKKVIASYLAAIEEFNPDLVHVWGAETFPGLLFARGMVKRPALLEIQGLKGPWAELYHGGLTFREQLKCIGLKELIRRTTIPQEAAFLRRWGNFEREIMSKFSCITTPSPWMAAHALAANPSARLFQNEIPLRKALISSSPWAFTGAPVLFCSSSYPIPYKGLHTLVRAAVLLRARFPNLQVRIAGAHQAPGLRRSGYVRWLNGEIERAGLGSTVQWLGSINAEQLCRELAQCSVAVFPSYAESYGVAQAEAMTVGTPCVVALNGGSTYLAEPGKTALFFPPGDHAVCAYQVRAVLESRELSESISKASRAVALPRHDPQTILGRQLQIYEDVANTYRDY